MLPDEGRAVVADLQQARKKERPVEKKVESRFSSRMTKFVRQRLGDLLTKTNYRPKNTLRIDAFAIDRDVPINRPAKSPLASALPWHVSAAPRCRLVPTIALTVLQR